MNVISTALTILELLALNAQKFTGSCDLCLLPFNAKTLWCHVTFAGSPFRKKVLGDYVGTSHRSMRAEFEVSIFNLFGAIST